MGYCHICGVEYIQNDMRCSKCKKENEELRGEIVKYVFQLVQKDESMNSVFWDIIKENRPEADKACWDYLTRKITRTQSQIKRLQRRGDEKDGQDA